VTSPEGPPSKPALLPLPQQSDVGDDRPVTESDAPALVRHLLDDLQDAVRVKDVAATLDLFTEDAALLGTAGHGLDRDAVSDYLMRVFDQTGYVSWDWQTVSVLDARPGAVTFVALGTVAIAGDPDVDSSDPIRLTCLAVEDSERWRIRLFHGSVPAS
jgi:uncharacterized protein (TIGR02246 family)